MCCNKAYPIQGCPLLAAPAGTTLAKLLQYLNFTHYLNKVHRANIHFLHCCLLFAVHGFLQATYDVNEDARLDTMFQLNVKGMTSLSTLTVTGTITAATDPDGTAS